MPAKKKSTSPKSPARAVRLHETSGSSTSSWSAAVASALRSVKDEIPTPVAVEIVRQWADVKAGKIVRFHVTVRIAWTQRLVELPSQRGKH